MYQIPLTPEQRDEIIELLIKDSCYCDENNMLAVYSKKNMFTAFLHIQCESKRIDTKYSELNFNDFTFSFCSKEGVPEIFFDRLTQHFEEMKIEINKKREKNKSLFSKLFGR